MPKRKAQRVAFSLLTRNSHPEVYARLDALVDSFHEELREARIALAWCSSWTPDVDGKLTLGKCKRASDLDRELAPFDFVILLLESFWTDEEVTNEQRDALLDHELMHATIAEDPETGEPKVDERGRPIYRLRKHDLEEFAVIAERHGTWKRDLEVFAHALRRHREGAQARLPMEASSEVSHGRTH